FELGEATLDGFRAPDEQRAEDDALPDERHSHRGEIVGGDVTAERPRVAGSLEPVDDEGTRADRPPGRALAGPDLTPDGGRSDARAIHALDVVAPRLLLEADEDEDLGGYDLSGRGQERRCEALLREDRVGRAREVVQGAEQAGAVRERLLGPPQQEGY